MTHPWSAARWYALAAAGVAAFTIYGSLVPFDFRWREPGDAVGSFAWAMRFRTGIESKSDGLANFLLGVPLGFAVLGGLRVDRGRGWDTVRTAALAWPGCAGLAVAVEFLQLYLPTRMCSGADVYAQSLGSAVGMVGWLAAGQRFTDVARRIGSDPRAGGRTGQLLAVYLGLILIVQTLPLDLTASPGAVYRKIRDGGVGLTPFGEWGRGDNHAGMLKSWVILFAVYLPAGLLAARLPNRGFVAVAAGAVGVAVGMEACQLFVSRSPSVTDVIVGVAAVVAGWAIARAGVAGNVGRFALGAAWVVALAVAAWFPFAVVAAPRWDAVVWVPFADLFLRNDLDIPGQVLSRMLAFAPLGILAGGRPGIAAGFAAGVAFVLEGGQLFVPRRVPGTTDVVLAAAGAWAAAVVTRKVRAGVPAVPAVVVVERRRAA